MSGLLGFGRDTLQAASNAIAGNVAGPVDLINAGLLGLGLPMPPEPVGGSKWMARRGLTREVADPYARVTGETLGLVGPTVVAAKAPQIAQGLLTHADQYRRYHGATTAPGAPATVWHGSPHRFDKFDSSKIGTGSGVSAQGHGIYLSASEDVGAAYRGPDGALYKVDLPDGMIEKMLSWQERVTNQPKSIRSGVLKAVGKKQYKLNAKYNGTGSDIYNNTLAGLSEADASELLAQSGIPGIRYSGNGTSNYVVFPGNEGLLTILGRE